MVLFCLVCLICFGLVSLFYSEVIGATGNAIGVKNFNSALQFSLAMGVAYTLILLWLFRMIRQAVKKEE